MNEQIVLLDDAGKVIGSAPKLSSHHGSTPLHLGFSCYIFNPGGEFLLTRRASTKKVWPGVWTNSVCGHPAPGEPVADAVRRRAAYELGLESIEQLEVGLPDYRYRTPPYDGIVENEICPVFVGRVTAEPVINPDEVAEYKWVRWPTLDSLIAQRPEDFSYWFKDQLPHLRQMMPSELTKPLNS